MPKIDHQSLLTCHSLARPCWHATNDFKNRAATRNVFKPVFLKMCANLTCQFLILGLTDHLRDFYLKVRSN